LAQAHAPDQLRSDPKGEDEKPDELEQTTNTIPKARFHGLLRLRGLGCPIASTVPAASAALGHGQNLEK
jgi:hypothetical protein